MAITEMIRDFLISKPILSIIFLLVLCVAFRVIVIFVLRLDEPPVSEIILSKALSLLLLCFYLNTVNLNFLKIGFTSENILRNVFIASVFIVLGLFIVYGGQFAYLYVKGAKPSLSIQQYTLFALLISVIAGNVINALMEEGLFRGLMITQFMNYTTFWRANIFQAAAFGIWHIVWPLKDFYLGKVVSSGALLGASAGEFFITFLMGLTMGYLFYSSGSLWTVIIWHFLMNLVQNMLVIKAGTANMDPAVLNTSATTIKGFSFIAAFIVINACIKFVTGSR